MESCLPWELYKDVSGIPGIFLAPEVNYSSFGSAFATAVSFSYKELCSLCEEKGDELQLHYDEELGRYDAQTLEAFREIFKYYLCERKIMMECDERGNLRRIPFTVSERSKLWEGWEEKKDDWKVKNPWKVPGGITGGAKSQEQGIISRTHDERV